MQQLAHNYGGPHANHNCKENKTNRKRQPHTEEDNHNCIEKKHEYKTKPNRKQLCLSVCVFVLVFCTSGPPHKVYMCPGLRGCCSLLLLLLLLF